MRSLSSWTPLADSILDRPFSHQIGPIRVRRFTVGIFILGIGTLFALPFRRGADGEQAVDQSSDPGLADAGSAMDLNALDLLVQEVADGASIPTVYHPHTDYSPPTPPRTTTTVPLTYEDVAVPVAEDPFYKDRFNATVVAQADPNEKQQRFQAANQRFARKSAAESAGTQIPPHAIVDRPRRLGTGRPSPQTPAVTNATLASAAAQEKSKADSVAQDRSVRGEHSVLKQLPRVQRESKGRSRHWIKQPE